MFIAKIHIMRRQQPVRIGELWGDFLQGAPGIARKIAEARVADLWPMVAGPRIAAYTTSVRVVHGIATVHISSAPARSEAFASRLQMRDQINRLSGMDVLKNLIIK
ncbi:hypothetical protein FACS1894159_03170 [Bacteroidia bacterium]|nr:hypothetical protein FACS1894159_03170 [Bacteroidia bacterium]